MLRYLLGVCGFLIMAEMLKEIFPSDVGVARIVEEVTPFIAPSRDAKAYPVAEDQAQAQFLHWKSEMFEAGDVGDAATTYLTPYTLTPVRNAEKDGRTNMFSLEHVLPVSVMGSSRFDAANMTLESRLVNSYRGNLALGEFDASKHPPDVYVRKHAVFVARPELEMRLTFRGMPRNTVSLNVIADGGLTAEADEGVGSLARLPVRNAQRVVARNRSHDFVVCRNTASCLWMPPVCMRGQMARLLLHCFVRHVYGRLIQIRTALATQAAAGSTVPMTDDQRKFVKGLRTFWRTLPTLVRWDAEHPVSMLEVRMAEQRRQMQEGDTVAHNPFVAWRLWTGGDSLSQRLWSQGIPGGSAALPPISTDKLASTLREAVHLPPRLLRQLVLKRVGPSDVLKPAPVSEPEPAASEFTRAPESEPPVLPAPEAGPEVVETEAASEAASEATPGTKKKRRRGRRSRNTPKIDSEDTPTLPPKAAPQPVSFRPEMVGCDRGGMIPSGCCRSRKTAPHDEEAGRCTIQ